MPFVKTTVLLLSMSCLAMQSQQSLTSNTWLPNKKIESLIVHDTLVLKKHLANTSGLLKFKTDGTLQVASAHLTDLDAAEAGEKPRYIWHKEGTYKAFGDTLLTVTESGQEWLLKPILTTADSLKFVVKEYAIE